MNPFQRPQVTDELLSAYIDGDVTAEEKNLVERAVKADANLAWRLESLQQTVNLLRSLPAVSLPRSFVLTEADVAPVKSTLPPLVSAARRTNRQRVVEPERSGFWQSFRDFLQGGNPFLRNMAAAGLAVWLLLFGVTILNPSRLAIPTMGHVETASVTGTNMQSLPATAAREVAIAQAAPDTSNAAAQPVNVQPANAQQSSSAQPGGVQENVQQQKDTAPTANSAELSQPAVVSQPAPADSEPHPAQSEPVVASKTMAVQNDASAAKVASPQLDSTQVQSDAPPALLAAGGPPGEDTSDPLSAAMSDTGGAMGGGTMGGGDVASADLSMPAPSESGEIAAAQVPADSVVAAAPPPVADVTAADVTAADVTASQVEAPANSATSETAVAEPASAAQIETQPAAIAAPAAAAPAPQEAAIATEPPPAQQSEAQAYAAEQPQSEATATPTAEPTLAPTIVPTEVPTVAIALAQPVQESAPVVMENREAQPVEQVMPLLDPIRMQLAQVTVALVTALLALFWLASQRGKKRRS